MAQSSRRDRPLSSTSVSGAIQKPSASARSIPFAMQSSLKGFSNLWYASKQCRLRGHPLARFFHELRRASQHNGDNAVVSGSYKRNKAIFHFGAIPELGRVSPLGRRDGLCGMFKIMLELVYECYVIFPTLIICHYTKEFFHLGR